MSTRVTSLARENDIWVIQTTQGVVKARIVLDGSGAAGVANRMLSMNERFKVTTGIQYELLDIPQEGYLDFYLWPKYSPEGYCVTGDTEVLLENAIKPISEVMVGERALTLEGWRFVTNKSSKFYDGDVISIIPFMLNKRAELTPEHEVYVWNKENGFEWKQAQSLVQGVRGKHRNGDYLVFPLPLVETQAEIVLSDYVTGIQEESLVYPAGRNQFGTVFAYKNGIKERLELTTDLMEFFGYYVSEGSTNSSGIIIGNNADFIIERTKTIGEASFGIKSGLWTAEDGVQRQVSFSSVLLKELFIKLFGEGSHNKQIPSFFHGLTKEQKLSFFKGLILGDGCKETYERKGKKRTVLSLTSVSKALIYGVWLLLAKEGIVSSIKYNKKKSFYQLRVAGPQLKELETYFGECHFGEKNSLKYMINGDKILVGIRKLSAKPYVGMVYDIEASGSFCPFFAIHNCWMIPKNDGRANVGLVTNDITNAKRYLDAFIKVQGWETKKVVKIFGGPIPSSGPVQHTVGDGILLIGDAAGFTSPLFEGGTQLGMVSGKMAAEVAKDALSQNKTDKQTLSVYEKKWKLEFPSYNKIIKGKDALYNFTEDELNRIGHLMPDELSNLTAIDKAKVGIHVLSKNRDLYRKGVIDAFLAFGYSRASHYGW
jgi:intein/homing endonuclease